MSRALMVRAGLCCSPRLASRVDDPRPDVDKLVHDNGLVDFNSVGPVERAFEPSGADLVYFGVLAMLEAM